MEFEFRNAIDIALVAAGLTAIIVWMRRARAGLAMIGTLGLAGVYLAAREYRLELTAWMLHGFFAIVAIILVVVFQDDLRRSFERLASLGLRRRRRFLGEQRTLQMLSETAFDLASQNRGALIVFPGRDNIENYVEGGRRLDGLLSRPLLMSLFDPSSPGHDGAVIVDGDRVDRFGVHLPLSRNFTELREGGTRHSAALGLSEATDALCVVVSEERGQVLLAQSGRLQRVETVESLAAATLQHAGLTHVERRPRRRSMIPRHAAEGAAALVLAMGTWWLFTSGTEATERTLRVPIRIENIDRDFEVEQITPREVEVVFQGLRRDLYLLDPTEVDVRLDASEFGAGLHRFGLADWQVRRPERASVVQIEPSSVRVELRRIEETLPVDDGSGDADLPELGNTDAPDTGQAP